MELPFESGRVIAFLVTIVLAQGIVSVILYLSRRSSSVDTKGSGEMLPSEVGENAFLSVIRQELEALPAGSQKKQQVARTLANLFNEHLESRTKNTIRDMSKQHERLMEGKSKEVSSVRQKYREAFIRRKQTESVLRSVAEGMVVVDKKGQVVFLNPAAEKLLGVKKEERIGKPLSDGLEDEQFLSLLKGSSEGEEREVTIYAGRDQTKRILRASNAVVEDENGKTVGMVSVLTDVTKQREIDQLKSDFVSSVTHELRTPIIAIQHSLGILLDQTAGGLSDQQKNFLAIANRNLGRLNYLIGDILDLKKLEARKMEMRFERASIDKVIAGVCESLRAWADSKEVRLRQQSQNSFPVVMFDPDRVTQVLNNLIGNAVKFSPTGGTVTIEAGMQPDGQALELSVMDTGVGMEEEDLKKLFQKFQRVGGTEVSGISGTGLGLAISKEIVEMHGGIIWAESVKGKGSKFSFTLPIKQKEGGGEQSGEG